MQCPENDVSRSRAASQIWRGRGLDEGGARGRECDARVRRQGGRRSPGPLDATIEEHLEAKRHWSRDAGPRRRESLLEGEKTYHHFGSSTGVHGGRRGPMRQPKELKILGGSRRASWRLAILRDLGASRSDPAFVERPTSTPLADADVQKRRLIDAINETVRRKNGRTPPVPARAMRSSSYERPRCFLPAAQNGRRCPFFGLDAPSSQPPRRLVVLDALLRRIRA